MSGNLISSLVIVITMLLYVSAWCPETWQTFNETVVRFSAHYSTSLCGTNYYLLPPKVNVTKNAMIRKWNRNRILNCYQNYDGSHFIVGHVNCEIDNRHADPVEFNCGELNFADYCPHFFLIGYTAWSNVIAKRGTSELPSCIQARHTKSIPVFGESPVESLNINLRCEGHAHCLYHTGVSLMYLKYKNNVYDGSDPNLGNCGLPLAY